MTLIPAYGRDYKSAKAVRADFDANLDFQICDISSPDDGRYINREQCSGMRVGIRYARLTKQLFIEVK